MKTSKFKTTAKCGGCVAKIGETLDKVVARDQWNIDLSTPDRVLTITSDLSEDRIKSPFFFVFVVDRRIFNYVAIIWSFI